jgi:hypothetical protein
LLTEEQWAVLAPLIEEPARGTAQGRAPDRHGPSLAPSKRGQVALRARRAWPLVERRADLHPPGPAWPSRSGCSGGCRTGAFARKGTGSALIRRRRWRPEGESEGARPTRGACHRSPGRCSWPRGGHGTKAWFSDAAGVLRNQSIGARQPWLGIDDLRTRETSRAGYSVAAAISQQPAWSGP